MKTFPLVYLLVIFSLALSACETSQAELATQTSIAETATAASWTATHNPTPTPNPAVALVQSILPSGYKYVSDYVTTKGGDSVWVIEVTESQTGMTSIDMARFFQEFAKAVDTSNVAWLEISVIKRSDGYLPYGRCVRSGPARAAANGKISDQDLVTVMVFTYCP